MLPSGYLCTNMNYPLHRTALFFASILLAIVSAGQELCAQDSQQAILHYTIDNKGDTVFVEKIRPAWVWGTGKTAKRDWRKYYRLVHNFSKSYPYAIVARKLVADTDSTFLADNMRRRKKDQYVNKLQKELFSAFEEPLKHLTVSQGQLIMKLIDREIGISSYQIIKDYKNGIAAGFWQGVAKMFGTDMKKNYDPYGEDKDIEDLVRIWNRGEFPDFYFSIFGKYPNIPEIPSKYR